jgi:hypothetical protein
MSWLGVAVIAKAIGKYWSTFRRSILAPKYQRTQWNASISFSKSLVICVLHIQKKRSRWIKQVRQISVIRA